MKKSRYSEKQIIAVLKEHQAGIPVSELCRKHGISEADDPQLAVTLRLDAVWRLGYVAK